MSVEGLGIKIINFEKDHERVRFYHSSPTGSPFYARGFLVNNDRTYLYVVFEPLDHSRTKCGYCCKDIAKEMYFFDLKILCPQCRLIFVKVIEFLEEPDPFLSRALTKLEYISPLYEVWNTARKEIMSKLQNLHAIKQYTGGDVWTFIQQYVIKLYFCNAISQKNNES